MPVILCSVCDETRCICPMKYSENQDLVAQIESKRNSDNKKESRVQIFLMISTAFDMPLYSTSDSCKLNEHIFGISNAPQTNRRSLSRNLEDFPKALDTNARRLRDRYAAPEVDTQTNGTLPKSRGPSQVFCKSSAISFLLSCSAFVLPHSAERLICTWRTRSGNVSRDEMKHVNGYRF